MLVLPEDQKALVATFFPDDHPAKVWLDAYFQNRVPGITYVDHVAAPTFSLVVLEFHHVTFVGLNGIAREFSAELAAVLAQEVYLEVVWPHGSATPFPQVRLAGQVSRQEFTSLTPAPNAQGVTQDSASDLEFSLLDARNFSLCESKGECLYAYETRERFLAECFGFVATRNAAYLGNAEVICQSGDRNGRLRADLQIIVAEPFRRSGIGFQLSRHLIGQVLARGIVPTWSCHTANEASMVLARKLGFADPVEYQMLSYWTSSVPPGTISRRSCGSCRTGLPSTAWMPIGWW